MCHTTTFIQTCVSKQQQTPEDQGECALALCRSVKEFYCAQFHVMKYVQLRMGASLS